MDPKVLSISQTLIYNDRSSLKTSSPSQSPDPQEKSYVDIGVDQPTKQTTTFLYLNIGKGIETNL